MAVITEREFFTTSKGGKAVLYTLRNRAGSEVEITNFGGAIVSIRVPDRNGAFADVALGFDSGAGYEGHAYFLGAMIGRCCNRIKAGRFTLNGKAYQLAFNDNGKNHLHGGVHGLESKLWDAEVSRQDGEDVLTLRCVCEDGEEGYPGRLEISVAVTFSEDHALKLQYQAVSDADTVCSLTNHSYFNLSGHASGDILGHELKLYASRFTEADAESIPTGQVLPVAGTPMDFREFHRIGERIGQDYPALIYGNGYDHNWVLDHPDGTLALSAELYDPESGRLLECYTDSPCMQVYTGNFIDGSSCGKEGCWYQQRAGIALETQYAPDAVNHPEWDSPILRKGDRYAHATIYRFSVK